MPINEMQVEFGANEIHRLIKLGNDSGIAPNCYELARGCLTAALTDQVALSKDEYDDLIKRDLAMAQVLVLARALGEATRKLDIAGKEIRKLVRQNKKLSAAPSSLAGDGK